VSVEDNENLLSHDHEMIARTCFSCGGVSGNTPLGVEREMGTSRWGAEGSCGRGHSGLVACIPIKPTKLAHEIVKGEDARIFPLMVADDHPRPMRRSFKNFLKGVISFLRVASVVVVEKSGVITSLSVL
jgi:hypothetical protein